MKLKVIEVGGHEVDRSGRAIRWKIVRIHREIVEKLGIDLGDVIEIEGKKRTCALAWPARYKGHETNMIAIDAATRRNANVKTGEYVSVRSADVKDAVKITLAPIGTRLKDLYPHDVSYRIMGRPFIKGEEIFHPLLGHPIIFEVVETEPDGIIIVVETTKIELDIEPRIGKRDIAVMTRLGYQDLSEIDKLVTIVLFNSRSEAVAYLTHEGITSKQDTFNLLSEKLIEITKIRHEAREMLKLTELGIPTLIFKICLHCNSNNPDEALYCLKCGYNIEELEST